MRSCSLEGLSGAGGVGGCDLDVTYVATDQDAPYFLLRSCLYYLHDAVSYSHRGCCPRRWRDVELVVVQQGQLHVGLAE